MTTYEYWRHVRTGEMLAVELRDGIVVGCFGPIHHDDLDRDFLDGFDYSAERAAEVESAREAWALVELP